MTALKKNETGQENEERWEVGTLAKILQRLFTEGLSEEVLFDYPKIDK